MFVKWVVGKELNLLITFFCFLDFHQMIRYNSKHYVLIRTVEQHTMGII